MPKRMKDSPVRVKGRKGSLKRLVPAMTPRRQKKKGAKDIKKAMKSRVRTSDTAVDMVDLYMGAQGDESQRTRKAVLYTDQRIAVVDENDQEVSEEALHAKKDAKKRGSSDGKSQQAKGVKFEQEESGSPRRDSRSRATDEEEGQPSSTANATASEKMGNNRKSAAHMKVAQKKKSRGARGFHQSMELKSRRVSCVPERSAVVHQDEHKVFESCQRMAIGTMRSLALISVFENKTKDLRLQVQLLASQQFFDMEVSADERDTFLRYCVESHDALHSKSAAAEVDNAKGGPRVAPVPKGGTSGAPAQPLRKVFEYMTGLLMIGKDATTGENRLKVTGWVTLAERQEIERIAKMRENAQVKDELGAFFRRQLKGGKKPKNGQTEGEDAPHIDGHHHAHGTESGSGTDDEHEAPKAVLSRW
eukprot:gnl/TRDRNA2_/TRDRNA2_132710_c0_seq1.p1 gnl/TRDRNA2_/TRDRNA2_132710_c0~~gnl/TRDRNA2_/TRDRNA2_132710_c0_seq1.p1  ORF type:complete len:418 (+),score=90.57 gnl/TRDRNA2_/TRDRNA2_132710_c0_seq1:1153-2406(+)